MFSCTKYAMWIPFPQPSTSSLNPTQPQKPLDRVFDMHAGTYFQNTMQFGLSLRHASFQNTILANTLLVVMSNVLVGLPNPMLTIPTSSAPSSESNVVSSHGPRVHLFLVDLDFGSSRSSWCLFRWVVSFHNRLIDHKHPLISQSQPSYTKTFMV